MTPISPGSFIETFYGAMQDATSKHNDSIKEQMDKIGIQWSRGGGGFSGGELHAKTEALKSVIDAQGNEVTLGFAGLTARQGEETMKQAKKEFQAYFMSLAEGYSELYLDRMVMRSRVPRIDGIKKSYRNTLGRAAEQKTREFWTAVDKERLIAAQTHPSAGIGVIHATDSNVSINQGNGTAILNAPVTVNITLQQLLTAVQSAVTADTTIPEPQKKSILERIGSIIGDESVRMILNRAMSPASIASIAQLLGG